MNKIFKILGLSAILALTLNADYKLVLTDKDGYQSEQCIKSYSFSNNLESIAKQNGFGKDIYSENETLTNKVYLGKPVYRTVVSIPDFTIQPNGQYVYAKSPNTFENIDDIVRLEHFAKRNWSGAYQSMSSSNNTHVTSSTNKVYTQNSHFDYDTKKIVGTFFMNMINFPLYVTDFKFIFEYTKTTDVVDDLSNKFKSYLIYEPSSSLNNEVVTINLEEVGVQFLKDYTYDANLDSCVKY